MSNSLFMSLVVGGFVGAASAYLGSLMVSKKMALVGDALGHVALPGMGIALVAGLDPSLGAFAFLMIGIFIIWQLSELTLLSSETLVGIVFVTSLAVGFLVVPSHELLESLVGDISKVTWYTVFFSVGISTAVILLLNWIYKAMILINISPDLAAVEQIPVRLYNFLYLFAIALIVALGVKVTGSLLVGALVIIPPATARILTTNLKAYILTSIFIGIASCLIGTVLSSQSTVPSGPAIILVGASFFVAAFSYTRFFARK